MVIPFRMVIQHEMVIDGLCLGGRIGGMRKFLSGDRDKARQEEDHCPRWTAEGWWNPQSRFSALNSSPCRFGELVFLGRLTEAINNRAGSFLKKAALPSGTRYECLDRGV